MLRHALALLLTLVVTALFSLGWFGILAVAEAALPSGGLWVWVVGLLLGSIIFGTLVTTLRDGSAEAIVDALTGRRRRPASSRR